MTHIYLRYYHQEVKIVYRSMLLVITCSPPPTCIITSAASRVQFALFMAMKLQ